MAEVEPFAPKGFAWRRDVNGNAYVVRSGDVGKVYADFCSMCIDCSVKMAQMANGIESEAGMVDAASEAMKLFAGPFSYAMAYEANVISDMDGEPIEDEDHIYQTKRGAE